MKLSESPLAAIDRELRRAERRVLIASPFVGRRVALYLAHGIESRREVTSSLDARALTSLAPSHFKGGFSSKEGVQALVESGLALRAITNLHAKVVVIDDWALVGSNNLTEAGVRHGNLELGLEVTGQDANRVADWFDKWWTKATRANEVAIGDVRRLPSAPRARSPHGQPVKGTTVKTPFESVANFDAFFRRADVEYAVMALRGGLISPADDPIGVRLHRMPKKRSLAYRSCALLRRPDSPAGNALASTLLMEVLAQHREVAARAHAAYRLGHDRHLQAGRRQKIRAALESARSQDSKVVARAASRALAAMANQAATGESKNSP